MRKMSKQDRGKAEVLVRDGGKAVQAAMAKVECYEVTLLLPPNDFFRDDPRLALDGTKPILLMRKQCS